MQTAVIQGPFGAVCIQKRGRRLDGLIGLDLDDFGSVGGHLVEPTTLGDGAGNIRDGDDPPSGLVPFSVDTVAHC
jgi:hypothetical protein